MARLSKPDLLRLVERAIQDSGWGFLKLGARDEHPARYHVYGDLGSRRIRVYVWNVTHGGGAARSATEYRIQITGVSLCTLHHRAFDRGLVTFDGRYSTHLNDKMIAEYGMAGLDGGLDQFRCNLRPFLLVPPDRRDLPNPDFIDKTNLMRGWTIETRRRA